MRKLGLITFLLFLVLSCGKEEDCIYNEGSGFSVIYDVTSCDISDEINGIQKIVYTEPNDLYESPCFRYNPILPLDQSNIIIMVMRVKSDFYYKGKKLEILRNYSNNIINFNFTLYDKVDSIGQVDNFYHSAMSVLDSVSSEQEVIFDVKFE